MSDVVDVALEVRHREEQLAAERRDRELAEAEEALR